MADPTNKIGEFSKNQDNIQTTYKVDSIAVCKIPPTTELHHKERGLSILITYMECFFAMVPFTYTPPLVCNCQSGSEFKIF